MFVTGHRSTYGNLTKLVDLLFRIYYVSIVFILSGEIAQVHTTRKGRRVEVQTALRWGCVRFESPFSVSASDVTDPGTPHTYVQVSVP